METRNSIIAIALSLLVFIVYMQFFAPQPQKPQKEAGSVQAKQEAVQKTDAQQQVKVKTIAAGIKQAAKGRDILIETDLVRAVINTAGGVISKWELKNFQEADTRDVGLILLYKTIMGRAKKEEGPKKELGRVQLLPDYGETERSKMVAPLTILPSDERLSVLSRVEFRADRDAVRLDKNKPMETLVLTYQGPAGVMIEKRLTFYHNEYKVDVAVTTKGLAGYSMNLGTDFGFADKISTDASGKVGMVVQADGKFSAFKMGDVKGESHVSGVVDWFGQEDKFFTAALLYGERGLVTSKKTTATPDIGDLLATEILVKDKPGSRNFTLYAGPKSFTILKAQGRGMEQMVDYGWFSIIAKPMFWLMRYFYNLTGNYGIAIILLTLVVRIIMFYPSLKSALSMEEMKKIQPLVLEIREKYKKDQKRIGEETMKLYKEHKVNPLGGCLPMLLQLPFFVALYNVLSVSIELRQAVFIPFWIKDLSVFDPYYILPVLMGGSMILMMKITTTAPDPKQEKMMMVMNIVFIFMFAWLPAGLLLYITLSNVFSIAQQLYVHRLITSREKRALAAS